MGNLKGKAYPRETYLKKKDSWVFSLRLRIKTFIWDLKKKKENKGNRITINK